MIGTKAPYPPILLKALRYARRIHVHLHCVLDVPAVSAADDNDDRYADLSALREHIAVALDQPVERQR